MWGVCNAYNIYVCSIYVPFEHNIRMRAHMYGLAVLRHMQYDCRFSLHHIRIPAYTYNKLYMYKLNRKISSYTFLRWSLIWYPFLTDAHENDLYRNIVYGSDFCTIKEYRFCTSYTYVVRMYIVVNEMTAIHIKLPVYVGKMNICTRNISNFRYIFAQLWLWIKHQRQHSHSSVSICNLAPILLQSLYT